MESPWGCVFYDRMQLSISENSLLLKKKKNIMTENCVMQFWKTNELKKITQSEFASRQPPWIGMSGTIRTIPTIWLIYYSYYTSN